MELMSRTKSEKFPDVSSSFLIPAMSNHFELKVKRSLLVDALRRVQVVADPQTRAVSLEIKNFSSVLVSTKQRNGSLATESVPVVWNENERLVVFNLDYLLSLLSIFDDEFVLMKLGKDQKHKPSSVLIQAEHSAGVLQQLRLDSIL
jgi:DNA polymerase III sliding clamp (beta) subunit (PCNA family)